MKYIHGFPAGYILDNILKMEHTEVLYWHKEYYKYKGSNMKKVNRTEENYHEQDTNLIGDTENSLQCYEETEEFEANQFAEGRPKKLTEIFKGE